MSTKCSDYCACTLLTYPPLHHIWCREVYISDDYVLVDLGIDLGIAVHTVHRGQHEFRFFNFFEIVNCNFTQTVSIHSTHRHGGHVKISHVGNSCMLEKIYFLAIISKMMWNFGILSAPVYGDWGLYRTAAKSWGFPSNFSTSGRQRFFTGVSVWRSTGDLPFILRGRHLCRLVERRWPHSHITFKKSLLIPYHERGTKFDTKKSAFTIHQFGRNLASGHQGATLKLTLNTPSVT